MLASCSAHVKAGAGFGSDQRPRGRPRLLLRRNRPRDRAGGGHQRHVSDRACDAGEQVSPAALPSVGDNRGMSVRAQGDQLDVAQHALEQAEWERARTGFEAVLEVGDSAPAYEGLGLALWFLGRVADGIGAREQAFEAYARDGRCGDAARVAVWVSHQHAIDGRSSAARGWLARAERVLTEVGRCAGHGWVALQRARTAPAVSDQIAYAHQAMEIARAEGDSDLEVYALSVLGKGEVNAGHRDTGMGLLEEAMAAASAGRVRNVHTLGSAYCNLVVACTSAGDWERAREWCDLVDDFARSHDAAPLLGACRTIHADMLLATGRWPEAERALQSALAVHARYVPGMDASTVATLAALRIQQGRLADAAQLLAGREEQPSSLRALALLRIAEGQPRVAVALLERGLQATEGNAMQATALLATLVDARLAAGQVEPAGTAAAQLEGIAADTGIRLVRARAELARARVVLAGPAPRRPPSPPAGPWPTSAGLPCRWTPARPGSSSPGPSAPTRPSWRRRRSARRWPCSGPWERPGRRTPPRRCCASSAAPPAGGRSWVPS